MLTTENRNIPSIKKALTLAAVLIVLSTPCIAAGARIEGVKVRYDSNLKVSFIVADAFKKDMEEAIQSGLPASFTFLVKLDRRRDLWFDERLGAWKFNHTVKYDALKEEYEVNIEEKNLKERTKDHAEMKRLMTTGEDVVISPLPALNPGEGYNLAIKAKLETVNLPPILNYMLFFVKFWDFETGWYTYNLTP
ncbi:MAG: DUF4390 domain-containing protein [Deltaproteobacteria bacterium]|nr:DUF4390 domain-containing protein [Deltaproteobacteria bacterium]